VPLISVTRLRIRSVRFLPAFFVYAFRSTRQAQRTPGNLGAAVFNDSRRTFWTRTAWRDEGAMRAFLLSGPHKLAMPKLAHWCDEASVVHWSQDTAELPAWPEAHRRMQAEGRPSRVRHPSAAHEAFRIAPPR
jgi:hypothetical protein